jgi:hypothetical protein
VPAKPAKHLNKKSQANYLQGGYMKNTGKDEVVWLYEMGERNFRRQNLRGRSFRGEDLSSADFSGSDIRGADFTNAILVWANFVNVTAGLQRSQAIMLGSVLFGSAAVLGLVAGAVGALSGLQLWSGYDAGQTNSVWITPIVVIAFAFVSLTRRMSVGFGIFGLAFLALLVAALASSAAIPLVGSIALVIATNALITAAVATISILMVAAVLAFRISTAILVMITFVVSFALALLFTKTSMPVNSIMSAVMIMAIVLPLSVYIGWCALNGKRQNTIIWVVANYLACKWGTSFRQADLTGADFSRATLKSTNFNKAILTNTFWEKTIWNGNSLD